MNVRNGLEIDGFTNSDVLPWLIRQDAAHFFQELRLRVDVSGQFGQTDLLLRARLLRRFINLVADANLERLTKRKGEHGVNRKK